MTLFRSRRGANGQPNARHPIFHQPAQTTHAPAVSAPVLVVATRPAAPPTPTASLSARSYVSVVTERGIYVDSGESARAHAGAAAAAAHQHIVACVTDSQHDNKLYAMRICGVSAHARARRRVCASVVVCDWLWW